MRADMSGLIGRVLGGRYRVVRAIGAGGMGAVFEADQLGLERKVALKVLLDTDPRALARLRQEALTAGTLRTPHVVAVFDFHAGGDDEPAFVVMEMLEGESLSALLRREKVLTPARAARIASHVLAGLDAAHRANIVHRDIKPSNIWVTRSLVDEVIKLLDFGIVKTIGRSEGRGPHTTTGSVMGTPSYLTPEQLRGEPVDARSDIHAVGVVLHEMLAGKKPWQDVGPSLFAEILDRVPAPLSRSAPGVPQALSDVVARALAKDPNHRFATAAEMISALAAASPPTGAVAPSVAQRKLTPTAVDALAPATVGKPTGAPSTLGPPPAQSQPPRAPVAQTVALPPAGSAGAFSAPLPASAPPTFGAPAPTMVDSGAPPPLGRSVPPPSPRRYEPTMASASTYPPAMASGSQAPPRGSAPPPAFGPPPQHLGYGPQGAFDPGRSQSLGPPPQGSFDPSRSQALHPPPQGGYEALRATHGSGANPFVGAGNGNPAGVGFGPMAHGGNAPASSAFPIIAGVTATVIVIGLGGIAYAVYASQSAAPPLPTASASIVVPDPSASAGGKTKGVIPSSPSASSTAPSPPLAKPSTPSPTATATPTAPPIAPIAPVTPVTPAPSASPALRPLKPTDRTQCFCMAEVNPGAWQRVCVNPMPKLCTCEDGHAICPTPWVDGKCGPKNDRRYDPTGKKNGDKCTGFRETGVKNQSEPVTGSLSCDACYGPDDSVSFIAPEGSACRGVSKEGISYNGTARCQAR